ncbi:restriction endonuclease subunit S [Neisseria sp.]
MSDWKEYKLHEIVEITSSKRIMRSEYQEDGIPFFRSKEIIELNSGNEITTELFISKERFLEIKNKFGTPSYGDILLTSVGTLGVPYFVNYKEEFYFKDGNLTWFRKFNNILRSKYLYYWFSSPVGRKALKEITIGSTQPALTITGLKSLTIHLPTLEEQDYIIEILDHLSSKIQLNTQINQTLEQIAQALFKSWFVDFDPVRAKVQALSDGLSLEQAELAAMQAISGKTSEELTALSQAQPERYAELAETAKAFPCEMVEVDGVEVPKGWECFSLKELSSVISKGTTPKKSSLNSCDSKETVPFIKVKDISESGQVLINQVEQIPKKISSTELKRSILHKNDILISIAGTIGRVAIVPNELENANTNQAISFIRLYNDNLVGIISTFLKSRKNQEDILSKVIQGVQANISLEVVRNIKIFLPINFDHKAILIFNSLLNKQLINQKENLLTEKSRDLLLPQLLSGEIDEK